MKLVLRRHRGDPVPTTPRAVLVVVLGARVTDDALGRATTLAAGAPLAVLGLLKIYGSAWGMPNPGLLPTAKERAEQLALVSGAIEELGKRGAEADGQIAATRNPVRAITGVAKRRSVHSVVIDRPAVGRVRRSLEGDVAAGVRRRLGPTVEVVVVDTAVETAKGRKPTGPAR